MSTGSAPPPTGVPSSQTASAAPIRCAGIGVALRAEGRQVAPAPLYPARPSLSRPPPIPPLTPSPQRSYSLLRSLPPTDDLPPSPQCCTIHDCVGDNCLSGGSVGGMLPPPPPPPGDAPCTQASACTSGCGITPEDYKVDAQLVDALPGQVTAAHARARATDATARSTAPCRPLNG